MEMSSHRADTTQKSPCVSFLCVPESCRRKESQVGEENDLMICEEGEHAFPTIQLLPSFQLAFVWSVRGFVTEQSVAMCSPQCCSAQHVITISLSSCTLLAHPFFDEEEMPPCAGAEQGNACHGCSAAAGAGTEGRPGAAVADSSDSWLWMNMCISIWADSPRVWKRPRTSSWWPNTSCFRCHPVLLRAPFGRQAWLLSPHKAEKLQPSHWEEAAVECWDTDLGPGSCGFLFMGTRQDHMQIHFLPAPRACVVRNLKYCMISS